MRYAWIATSFAVLSTAAVIVAYLRWGESHELEWLHIVPPGLTALAVGFVAVRSRPARPVPWAVLAVGFGVVAAAAAIHRDAVLAGDVTFPGDREAILLMAYPALFVGMIGLTSSRRRTRDLLAGSEPIIYTIAIAALVWVAVSGPHFDDEGFPLASETWVWVFPLLSGVLAMLSVRRMSAEDGLQRYELITLGFLALGAGHAIVGWTAHEGDLEPGSWVAIAPAVGFLLVTVGIVSPAPVRRRDADRPAKVHWTQIFGLLVAALVPLGCLLLMLATGLASRSSSIVVSAATIAVMVLALVRMWGLVDQLRSMSEQQGRDRLAAMVEHSSDVVVLTDADGTMSYVSPGVRTMLGHEPEHWLGRHMTDILVEGDRESASGHFRRAVADEHGGTIEFEAGLTHADGHQRKATVVAANLIGGAAVDGIVVTIRDVTEQRNLERQLSHRAFHDELTGLANRALFLDRMDHALRVERSDIDPVIVLFVDLDDFKAVNDECGHGVGDQVLKTIAERIRRAAGSGDTAARLGGDEFALLLEDRGGVDRALDVAERLLDSMREPIEAGGHETKVLASIGVALATAGMSTTSLLRDADIAMYEAKRAGKGQIRIFDPAMRLDATKHLEYRADLAVALERDQFGLVFQPYVDLASGQVVGAEALVRWHHPDRGELSPAEFLPVAERSGLIVDIGRWVIERALTEAERWRPGLLIGINVSAAQLADAGFADLVTGLVTTRRIDPATIVLEFTEAVLDDDDERITSTLARLRDVGVGFAIDDFGTGNCSLSTLQRQPVDLLKIDGTAVERFGDDPAGPSLVRTILQTATTLGISTVAEGIETTTQLEELRDVGCTFGQGFLLSRPLDAAELERRFGHPDTLAVG